MKIKSLFRKLASQSWTITSRQKGLILGGNVQMIGRPIFEICAGSQIEIGERVVLISWSRFAALGVKHPVIMRTYEPGAQISIANDVGITGAVIIATVGVSIGRGTLLGSDVSIFDTDFHPIGLVERRYADRPRPRSQDAVVIGENVFVGAGAVILKGVKIGDNSVVGAGSVVTKNVEANTIVAGNPARYVARVVNSSFGS